MEIRFSAHGAYHHQYHVVWIPKYRKKILKGDLKGYLNQTARDWHTRVVTLNAVKGLKDRFFAMLRMTGLGGHIVKCTNVMHSGLEKGLVTIEQFHPDVVIEKFSIQADHVHLIMVIPPKYAVSAIIGKLKANTSREVRTRFPWLKQIYWRNECWSVGVFSSTVGLNEDVIKRYVEFQEKVDTGQVQLHFGF